MVKNQLKSRNKMAADFEARFYDLSGKMIGLILATTLVAFFVGCASAPERPSAINKNTSSSTSGGGVQSPTIGENGMGAAKSADAKPKVAVILGPGGYKTFAHAGVLKELKKKNIPVQGIVGMEWGALAAALFAQRGQIHEAEWKLYKLEKLNLNSSGFFSRKKDLQPTSLLRSYLKENLNVADTSQTAVPFFCPSLSLSQGGLIWQEHGSLAKSVADCISYPPVMVNDESGLVAGLFSIENIIMKLRSSGFNVIILVNVLGDGNLFDNPKNKDDYATAILWTEVRRAMYSARSLVTDVIDVNTRGIGLTDFESRKLLVTAGEAAGEKAAQAISTKYDF